MIGMATAAIEQLEDLEALARRHNADGRRVILENVADLFLSSEGRLSERESALMTDILHKLVTDVEMTVRRNLAERLAEIDEAPHDLVVALANDDIEVAKPVLLKSGVLRDADLIQIVKNRTQEHLLQVARREALQEGVTDALVDRGEDDVIEALLVNKDASISRQALSYIVERSKRVDRFQEPLVARADLPPDLAHKMFWWVSAALRDHILHNSSLDPGMIDALIQETTQSAIDDLEPLQPGHTVAQNLVRGLANRGALTTEFIMRTLDDGEICLFTAALAERGRLDFDVAERIVLDAGGEPLAVLCRAVGLDRKQFINAYLMSRTTRGNFLGATVSPESARLFETLTEHSAMAALQYWRQDEGFQRARTAIADTSLSQVA
ncbi:MAG: DUF2336 domain-containing protein [Alphaproteobacteria bacterium]